MTAYRTTDTSIQDQTPEQAAEARRSSALWMALDLHREAVKANGGYISSKTSEEVVLDADLFERYLAGTVEFEDTDDTEETQ